MPFTFRKRIRLGRLVSLNIGKKSASLSAKAGPFTVTRSTTGRTTTSVDLPGPFGYRKTTRRRRG
jgi:hypothetical protein